MRYAVHPLKVRGSTIYLVLDRNKFPMADNTAPLAITEAIVTTTTSYLLAKQEAQKLNELDKDNTAP